MSLATAVEFATLLTAPATLEPQPPPGVTLRSARERELFTLVAQGHTDAQIAGQLFISVRTVRSHLDRIRDKSGCRRRADLTRFALQAASSNCFCFPGPSGLAATVTRRPDQTDGPPPSGRAGCRALLTGSMILAQAETGLALAGCQALARDSSQDLQLSVITRWPDVLVSRDP